MSYVKALTKRESLLALATAALLATFLLPIAVSAQINIDESIVGQQKTEFGLGTLNSIIGEIFNFVVFIAAAFVVIFLLWGGISYMMSGGNEEKREAAKQRMITGVIGAAIILGVGVIIATIGGALGGSVS